MITIVSEINIWEFKAWAGGKDTLQEIADWGKLDELNDLILSIREEWTDTGLNDFLWFDREYIYECLGWFDRE